MTVAYLFLFASVVLAVMGITIATEKDKPLHQWIYGKKTQNQRFNPLEFAGQQLSNLVANRLKVSISPKSVVQNVLLGMSLGLLIGLMLFHSAAAGAGIGVVGSIALIALGIIRERKKRWQKISEQLEAALIRMSSALRAGADLYRAIGEAATFDAPLGDEFREVRAELELGQSPTNAIDNMYKRIPMQEIRLMATAIRISQESGGDLATNLELISDTIRQRVITQAQVNAATATPRMESKMMLAIALGAPVVVYFFMPQFKAFWFQSPLMILGLIGLYILTFVIYKLLGRMTDVDL